MRVALVVTAICMASAHAGTITYEIVDYTKTPDGTVIATGQKNQKASDLIVKKREGRGKTLWSKSVLLEKGFEIGFNDSKDQHLTGFGMWVQTEPDSSSWDWFKQDSGLVFKKLQESGRVKVRTAGAPAIEEIAEIEFLTDVSLRTTDMSSHRILHRVNIKKGSVLSVIP